MLTIDDHSQGVLTSADHCQGVQTSADHCQGVQTSADHTQGVQTSADHCQGADHYQGVPDAGPDVAYIQVKVLRTSKSRCCVHPSQGAANVSYNTAQWGNVYLTF